MDWITFDGTTFTVLSSDITIADAYTINYWVQADDLFNTESTPLSFSLNILGCEVATWTVEPITNFEYGIATGTQSRTGRFVPSIPTCESDITVTAVVPNTFPAFITVTETANQVQFTINTSLETENQNTYSYTVENAAGSSFSFEILLSDRCTQATLDVGTINGNNDLGERYLWETVSRAFANSTATNGCFVEYRVFFDDSADFGGLVDAKIELKFDNSNNAQYYVSVEGLSDSLIGTVHTVRIQAYLSDLNWAWYPDTLTITFISPCPFADLTSVPVPDLETSVLVAVDPETATTTLNWTVELRISGIEFGDFVCGQVLYSLTVDGTDSADLNYVDLTNGVILLKTSNPEDAGEYTAIVSAYLDLFPDNIVNNEVVLTINPCVITSIELGAVSDYIYQLTNPATLVPSASVT